MPFVEASHREKPDLSIAGDRCFLEYQLIMKQWSENPRWATVDKIFKDFLPLSWCFSDQRRAQLLALAVFFCIHVMNYEQEKRKLNGDIL